MSTTDLKKSRGGRPPAKDPKSHKIQVRVTKEEKEMVEYGEKPLSDVLLTGANRFNIMASRAYGSRIGMTGLVGWERGRIVEPSVGLLRDVEAARNAIRTKRGE